MGCEGMADDELPAVDGDEDDVSDGRGIDQFDVSGAEEGVVEAGGKSGVEGAVGPGTAVGAAA